MNQLSIFNVVSVRRRCGIKLKGLLVGLAISATTLNISGQILDDGYLWIDGTVGSPLSWSNEPQERFIWNSDKNQFTAGTEGLSSTTAGTYTFSFGERARAKGSHSTSFGYHIYSDAPYSFGAGQNVSIDNTADGSIALGLDLTIDGGSGAVALGDTITVDGDGAFAAGQNTSAEGWGSVSMGYSTVVDLSSSSSAGAYAIGRGLTVKQSDAFVVGRFNDLASETTDTYAFVVGNGADGSNRADAFWVDIYGNVGASGAFDITGDLEASSDLYVNGYLYGSNPTATMQIASPAVEIGVGASSSTEGGELRFEGTTTSGTQYVIDSYRHATITNGDNVLRFRPTGGSSGNFDLYPDGTVHFHSSVGIGTVPTYGGSLDVYGNAVVSGWASVGFQSTASVPLHVAGGVRIDPISSPGSVGYMSLWSDGGAHIYMGSSVTDHTTQPVSARRNWEVDNLQGKYRIFSDDVNTSTGAVYAPTVSEAVLNALEISDTNSDESKFWIRSEKVVLEHVQGDVPVGDFN